MKWVPTKWPFDGMTNLYLDKIVGIKKDAKTAERNQLRNRNKLYLYGNKIEFRSRSMCRGLATNDGKKCVFV